METLLNEMWEDYCQMNPSVKKIFDLFKANNSVVNNDHIALRTFDLPKVNIDVLAQPFLKNGYSYAGEYNFEQKKLFAKHLEPSKPGLPKVFISQLLTKEFSKELQQTIAECVEQIPDAATRADNFTTSGLHWKVDYSTYQKALEESEYAAWMLAFGFRPNHFTVFVNELEQFSELTELNEFIKANGFKLNSSGGEIKGSKEVLLEQSSTMAEAIPVEFSDGTQSIPGCYYEFAKRYPLPNGDLYQGFVAASADKIFESTNQS